MLCVHGEWSLEHLGSLYDDDFQFLVVSTIVFVCCCLSCPAG
jgi:hypothetical protein